MWKALFLILNRSCNLGNKRKNGKKNSHAVLSIFLTQERSIDMRNFFFAFLFSGAFLGAHSNELFLDGQTQSRLKVVAAILEDDRQVEDRLDVANSRLYLEPGRIFIANHGFFYSKESGYVFLPMLFSDQQGYFLHCSSQDLSALAQVDGWGVWWCPACKSFRKMNNGCCLKCGRQLI